MTRYYFFILVTIIIAGCSSDNSVRVVESHDSGLSFDNGKLIYRERLFTGVISEDFADGKSKSKTAYRNGLEHGIQERWFENGQLESQRYFHRGEKNGIHRGWWEDGTPRFEYHFVMGNYHGFFREWYRSGRLLHEIKYQEGREISALGWRENGKTFINYVVKGGRKYGLTNARLCYSLKDEFPTNQSAIAVK